MSAGLPRPLICLVSGRFRLQPPGQASLLRLVVAAAHAGVDLIQIREPDLDDHQLLQLASAAVTAVAGSGARIILNERTDIALAAAAHGVHLRADSVTASQVRKIVPSGFLIGRSVHGQAEASRADSAAADYLIAGTVFRSASKPEGAALLGLDGLTAISAAARIPVLAIGGVVADKVEDVAAAGSSGIAAIGLFADLPTTGADDRLEATLQRLVARLRKPFLRGRAAGATAHG